MKTMKTTTRKVAKKPMAKAQKGKEVSMYSSEGKKRMSGMKYPKSAKTASDSTSYAAGYASSKNVTGYGKAGATANPNYKKGATAGLKQKKYGGSMTKKTTTRQRK